MNLCRPTTRPRPTSCRGFTFPEVLIASGILGLVFLAAIYVNIMAMRLDKLTNNMADLNDHARYAFGQLASDIRSAKGWKVGNYTNSVFTNAAAGSALTGNAICLYPTTATNYLISSNNYVIYYFSNNCLMQLTPSTNQQIVSGLTNTMSFTAETPGGLTLSNYTFKGVIHVAMEFAQYQYQLVNYATNASHNDYRLDLRLASHIPDGP